MKWKLKIFFLPVLCLSFCMCSHKSTKLMRSKPSKVKPITLKQYLNDTRGTYHTNYMKQVPRKYYK